MAIVKLSVSERRRLTAFVICLVLAAVAWLLAAMSNNYTFTVKEIVAFKNGPQRRAFHPLQSDTVEAKIQGTGWEMLFSRMSLSNRRITVDISRLENQNFIALNTQLNEINNRREIGEQVLEISPDTLYFDFTNRSVKRVPVKALLNVKYRRQYGLMDDITIKPAYVTVSGPSYLVNSITAWKTDSISLKDVFETVDTRVKLQPVHESNLMVYPKMVEVQLPVDEFTEKTVAVPVKLINNHNYYNVKIFPQKVKVTFTISLSRYADTDEDYFEATADLDLWKNNGYSMLPIKITHQPDYSRIVKVEPANIDFIIKK
jgi:YbbR domain-containing protein